VTIRGTKTALRYDREVLRDLEDHRAEYDLQKAVENLRIPLLIVHGAEDVAVKRSEPDSLYALADRLAHSMSFWKASATPSEQATHSRGIMPPSITSSI